MNSVVLRVEVKPLEYFNWLVYPLILLLALNVMYRKEFAGKNETMEGGAI